MKPSQVYYSEEFDEKVIINEVYSKTIDVTYVKRPDSIFEKSNRKRRENKLMISQYLADFFKIKDK